MQEPPRCLHRSRRWEEPWWSTLGDNPYYIICADCCTRYLIASFHPSKRYTSREIFSHEYSTFYTFFRLLCGELFVIKGSRILSSGATPLVGAGPICAAISFVRLYKRTYIVIYSSIDGADVYRRHEVRVSKCNGSCFEDHSTMIETTDQLVNRILQS